MSSLWICFVLSGKWRNFVSKLMAAKWVWVDLFLGKVEIFLGIVMGNGFPFYGFFFHGKMRKIRFSF